MPANHSQLVRPPGVTSNRPGRIDDREFCDLRSELRDTMLLIEPHVLVAEDEVGLWNRFDQLGDRRVRFGFARTATTGQPTEHRDITREPGTFERREHLIV